MDRKFFINSQSNAELVLEFRRGIFESLLDDLRDDEGIVKAAEVNGYLETGEINESAKEIVNTMLEVFFGTAIRYADFAGFTGTAEEMRSVIPEWLTPDYVISKQVPIFQLFFISLALYLESNDEEQNAIKLLENFVTYVTSNPSGFANIVNYNLPIPDMG